MSHGNRSHCRRATGAVERSYRSQCGKHVPGPHTGAAGRAVTRVCRKFRNFFATLVFLPSRRRGKTPANRHNALVAQWIEHRFPKPGVAGSIPAGGTTLMLHRALSCWGVRQHRLPNRQDCRHSADESARHEQSRANTDRHLVAFTKRSEAISGCPTCAIRPPVACFGRLRGERDVTHSRGDGWWSRFPVHCATLMNGTSSAQLTIGWPTAALRRRPPSHSFAADLAVSCT